MRIVIVSDTHCAHEELGILKGDVLIHCGDGCNGYKRDPEDVDRLDRWFSRQYFDAILCIGGNHDFEVERRAQDDKVVFANAIYLQDTAYEYRGVVFYGAPWVPVLGGWAFYQDHEQIRTRWEAIPEEIDVLITHIPPFGILDRDRHGHSLGCSELLDRLQAVRPRLHAFGHNHASAGTAILKQTLYVNASMVDRQYRIARSPFAFEFDDKAIVPVARDPW
jgi:Icc-related predicted phosphoesterase